MLLNLSVHWLGIHISDSRLDLYKYKAVGNFIEFQNCDFATVHAGLEVLQYFMRTKLEKKT